MKKIIALLLVMMMALFFVGCGKKVNPADYDDGPAIDTGTQSDYAAENPGDPYAQAEIGHSTAYKNLITVFGDYDSQLGCYVRYEYAKDGTHEGNPCYLYSRMISKEQDGEYTHYDYIAVYKDGSMMAMYGN